MEMLPLALLGAVGILALHLCHLDTRAFVVAAVPDLVHFDTHSPS